MSTAPPVRPVAGWPRASTVLVGVIGDPVRHSATPELYNAAFGHLEMDWACVALPVRREDGRAAILGARASEVRGLAVTMPHKQVASALADRRTASAARLGAANTLVFDGGMIVADSTDGQGFLDDLVEGGGFDPAGLRCAVIGSGGSARAVVLALAGAGAARVLVVNRSGDRAAAAASLAGPAGAVGAVEDLADVALVVNATPVGMAGGPPAHDLAGAPATSSGGPAAFVGPGQLCYDLVYHPAETPFLHAARGRGAATRNGLGMLVHQAAVQFRLLTGIDAPLEVMWQAVSGRAGALPAPDRRATGCSSGTPAGSGGPGVPEVPA